MRGQLQALIRVKLLLLKHTFTTNRAVSLILIGVIAVGACAVSLSGGVGLFFLGRATTEPVDVMIVCDILLVFFLSFWAFSLLMELQRSDIIDLRKILYLPVSLKMVFALNYVASLVSPAVAFFAFPVLGFCLGLSLGLGLHMVLGIVPAIVFYLALGAWTYYVQGLFAILMENKRRRRTVVAVVTMGFVLVFQLPNLISQVYLRRHPDARHSHSEAMARGSTTAPDSGQGAGATGITEARVGRAFGQSPWGSLTGHEETRRGLVWANAVVPFGWLPLGVYGLATGSGLTVLLCFLGLVYLAVFGLALGYRSTVRYYMGVKRRGLPKPAKPKTRDGGRLRTIERAIPFVDDDTASVAMVSFLSYSRLPNIRMMLIMPVVLGAAFLTFLWGRGSGMDAARVWVPLAAIVWPFMSFSMILFNLFGTDGDGFRALILLPTPRYKYLLGKNLALFPFVGTIAVVFIALSGAVIRPPISIQIIALLHVVELYLLFCVVGNCLSVYFPFTMKWEGLRGVPMSRRPAMMMLGFLSLFAVMGLMLPTVGCVLLDTYLLPWLGYEGALLGPLISAVFPAIAIAVYALTLKPMGNLLFQREQRMLELLARDRE